jgi:hypothetical protein
MDQSGDFTLCRSDLGVKSLVHSHSFEASSEIVSCTMVTFFHFNILFVKILSFLLIVCYLSS